DRDLEFHKMLSQIVEPYPSLFAIKEKDFIYSGEESIPFTQRHPTFKTLMKLEFQNAIHQFKKK
ncbi:MAG: hypothetical protein P8Y23_12845, partial [Candidatus Lokiarchaeota archaeon]